ncbi:MULTISPECIES: MBL fold metallo-hydrolase [unclassified Haladaptatus]|uniref:MBL fold metallo-hydrolase n=1 Tax=unclassified Haladaptatus TaxID=2622732 RepID=UPI0023E7933C|nr:MULTISPECIES: MBL fold metallo-hydrolase [unclassified Haladaptatus]
MISNLAQGVQAFTSNVFLVSGERTVLVDPGSGFDVVSKLEERTEDLDAIVLTHTHPDHVGNVTAVKNAFDVDVWGYDPDSPFVDHAIEDGETVQLGDDDYTALHTPGHKNDHLCFHSPTASVLFAGDLVFQNGSFGRTDLPEGDRELLIKSIERLIATLDSSLSVMHVGHGPSITSNPYDDIELSARMARMQ